MEDIRTNGHILKDSIQHITPSAINGRGLFPAGSYILSTTATLGEYALLIADSLANQRFTFLVKNVNRTSEVNEVYFLHFLAIIGDWCKKSANAGGLLAVNMFDLKNYEFLLPPVKEQHRIATVLSSVEEQIATLQSLISKYESIKKATVNLLLKPKCNWHSIKLKEFESHKNNTCSRSLTTTNSGRIRNIHYGDILVKFKEILSLKDYRIDCLTNEGELRSPADYIQDGDIIIADTAEDETAGKVVEMRDVEDNKAVAGLHTVFLRPPKMLFARGWLGYWMNSRYYHDQLLPYMTGIKVLSLSRSSLYGTLVFYPSMSEQERIVSVFESINSHISILRIQAAKLQRLKDGMMSYFFG